jgi:trehalose 6-phosphate synthase/phosphatase
VAGRSAPRLVIAANRLPVTVRVSTGGRITLADSVGGVATGLLPLLAQPEHRWLGWPGVVDGLAHDERARLDTELRRRRLEPLHLSPDEVEQYYESYANGVLWPLLHSFPDRLPLEPTGWATYEAVNRRFAQRLAALAAPQARVWVHDYQLMLVPGLLRQLRPDLRIGFFLHVPFPGADIFRLLPQRDAILRGLLGADLIGLHTQGYARNLLAAASAADLASAGDGLAIRHAGRLTTVGVFPMGVDGKRFERLAERSRRRGGVKAFRRSPGLRVFVGVDRLDYTKGIPRRLLAYERLLERDPALRGHVRLVQVAVPSRDRVPAYRSFHAEVERLIRRINGRFATPEWVPVHWIERSMDAEALAALYRAVDVLLVTPIRDGMNLVAKEFIASRSDGDGVLLLSEFAGASHELVEALIVNPYDIDGTATCMARALAMPRAERRLRMRALRDRIAARGIDEWTAGFLAALDRAAAAAGEARPRLAAPLELDRLVERVARARRLVVLVDYDGTLVPFSTMPELAAPDAPLLELLGALARRPRTAVHVLSGRDRHTLGRWLGDLPIGLHAEHGVWSRDAQGTWRRVAGGDARWRDRVRTLMQRFVDETPGARLEQKSEALAWHWRGADPDFGARQARRLEEAVHDVVAEETCEVLLGHRVVEVRPEGIHKGQVVDRVLEKEPDDACILAFGDDRTDEDLFAALPQDAVAVHVGDGESAAGYRVAAPADVRRLLAAILATPALTTPRRDPPRRTATRARGGSRSRSGTRRSPRPRARTPASRRSPAARGSARRSPARSRGAGAGRGTAAPRGASGSRRPPQDR